MAAVVAVLVPTSSAGALTVQVRGEITSGDDGTCGGYVFQDPVLHWHCGGATETYTGSLDGLGTFTVEGAFNTASGATVVSGLETFDGCVVDSCGMLRWNYNASFSADPVTATAIRGRGQAHITGGTGDFEGVRGSLTFACLPDFCTYKGSLVLGG